MKMTCLEFKTKKKLKLVVLSSRPKKMKKSCLEVKTIKNKGEVLRSRLKILRNFRSKNGFLLNIAGSETPQTGEYVYYMPELWKVISEISTGVYRVESCLSRTRKVSTLELLAPANIRSRALQTEVELQSQCAQLEKLKSTNSLLQKDLVELRQKLDRHCDKAKRQQEKHWEN